MGYLLGNLIVIMGGCYNYRTYNFFIFFNVVGTKQTRDQSKSRVVKGHKFGIGQKGMIGFVCQRSTVIGRTDEFCRNVYGSISACWVKNSVGIVLPFWHINGFFWVQSNSIVERQNSIGFYLKTSK